VGFRRAKPGLFQRRLRSMRFDRRELAGAVADLGVLVPIAVALIVSKTPRSWPSAS